MRNRVYSFDDWAVDPAARELSCAGAAVVVPPKAFDCIVYLIEHRDRAVGRDELVAAVWGKLEIGDDQLAYIVRKARRAVSDSGDEQAAIRTIPRFGFRWVRAVRVDGQVTISADEAVPAKAASAPVPPSLDASRPKALASKAWILLASLLALIAIKLFWHSRPPVPPPDPRSDSATLLALDATVVLPVDGGPLDEADWSWLRLGLMDLIANRLRDAGMVVTPSGNVVALLREEKVSESSAESVRAATSARYLIAPTLAKRGDDWVAHLQLSEAGQPPREVEAHATDPIRAARLAADQLLDRLGKHKPDGSDSPATLSVEEFYQRVETSVLTGDFDGARRRLAAAPRDLLGTPELRLRQASVELKAGSFLEAQQRFTDLLSGISAEADATLRARALIGLGSAYFRLGKQALAKPRLTEALALLDGSKTSSDIGEAYYRRATVHLFQARYDEARADFAQAHVAFELAGDTLAVARVELGEGALYGFLGRLAEAPPLFESAARQFERFGAVNELSTALSNRISAHLQLLQPIEALRVATLAGARFDDLKNAQRRHVFEWQRARALLANGRLTEARALLDGLARSVDPTEEPGMPAWVQAIQARLDFEAGSFETAAALGAKAVDGSSAPRDISTREHAWLTAIRALRGLGRSPQAAMEVRRFREWADASDDAKVKRSAQVADAEQVWTDGRRDAAAGLFEQALDEAARDGTPDDVAEVARSYGQRLIDDGQLERASVVVGQIARWADRDFACAVLQARLYRALGQRDAWKAALSSARGLAGERPLPASVGTFEQGELGSAPQSPGS